MSRHPAYPSNSELESEYSAEEVLNEQRAVEAAWNKLVRQFILDADRFHFPICFPVAGYDLEHVIGMASDWIVNDAATMEQALELV